jgi:hypothetical protein
MLKECIYNAQVTIETSKNVLQNPPSYHLFFSPFTLPYFSSLFCLSYSRHPTALHISLEFPTVQDSLLIQHSQKQVGRLKVYFSVSPSMSHHSSYQMEELPLILDLHYKCREGPLDTCIGLKMATVIISDTSEIQPLQTNRIQLRKDKDFWISSNFHAYIYSHKFSKNNLLNYQVPMNLLAFSQIHSESSRLALASSNLHTDRLTGSLYCLEIALVYFCLLQIYTLPP